VVLRPAALTPVGVARLLEDHWGSVPSDEVAARVAAWTGGNPFLVTAIARGGREGGGAIPDAVTTAVTRLLGRLSQDEAALARAVSVLGTGTPLRHAARLASLDRAVAERAADRLAHVGLLTPGDPLRFQAPVEGAAIAGSITPFARAEAHRRAAKLLTEEEADVLQVADHLLLTSAAGDPRVVAALRAAAERAIVDGHPARAVRYLRRALDEPPPSRERDETVLRLVTAELRSGQPTSLEGVERILDRLGEGAPLPEALRQLATLQFLHDEGDRVAGTLQRALDQAGGDERLRQSLLSDYLAAASFAPQRREDLLAGFDEVLHQIAAGARLPDDPGLRVQVAAAMATRGTTRTAVLPIVEGLVRTTPAGDGPPFGLFASWACSAYVAVDELELAEQLARRCHRAARDAGDVVRQCLSSYWLGTALFHEGRAHEAAAQLELALRCQDAFWTSMRPWAAAALCVVQLERGLPHDAVRALRHAADADPSGLHMGVVLEARGHVAMAEGNPAAALRHFEASGAHLDLFGIDAPTLITWRSNAVFAIRAGQGDLRRAHELAQHELDQARSIGAPRQQARALRAVAAARPATSEAVPLLYEALAITEAAGPRLEHLHVLTDLAEALIAAGDLTAAREPLHAALEASQGCGAAATAARAQRLLRAAGIRPRRAVRAGVGALTAAELQVAALAASGLTNRSIADALTVSERTVESHLYNAFGKLGIHRREQLASHLPQQGA
jgi:DNA-binding CsgD family transcriptional regulator